MEGMDMTFETSTGIGADVLTTTETLAAHLEDETVAVVEVDEDTSAFGNGHIPGAVSLDWAQELHAKPRPTLYRVRIWQSSSQAKASPLTRPLFSMAAITTGLRPMPTGSASCGASTT
jgi:hypothetical protein